jgi:hypothetical protein
MDGMRLMEAGHCIAGATRRGDPFLRPAARRLPILNPVSSKRRDASFKPACAGNHMIRLDLPGASLGCDILEDGEIEIGGLAAGPD